MPTRTGSRTGRVRSGAPLSGNGRSARYKPLIVTPRITTDVVKLAHAKEVRLLCPHCAGSLIVHVDWPYLRVERQRRISKAIEEHRKVCAGAPPEAGRVYQIDYPRA